MSVSRRNLPGAAGLVLLAALCLIGLHALAARLVAGHLTHVADRQLARLEHGLPPWQWSLRQPHDLVAGRAFGAADLQATPDGLRATSRDGTPFELGLPVRGMLDPGHWPRLTLHGSATAPFRLGVTWQPQLDQPGCRGWLETPVAAGTLHTTLDLRRLHRQADRGGDCAAPQRIAMLRLLLVLPAKASLQLSEVSLGGSGPLPRPERPDLSLSPNLATAAQQLTTAPLPAAPWVALPAGASAETQLALRQAVWQQRPAALILPQGVAPVPTPPRHRPGWLAWLACCGYLLALAAVARFAPPAPWRRWLELAAGLAGPLWLIAGLQLGLRLSLPSLLSFAGTLMFVAQAEWRRRPRDWRWSGDTRAWLLPMALLPVALLLVAVAGGPLHLPKPGHVLVYLLWAALQQWLVLVFVARRLQGTALPPGLAVLLAALVFALLHTPNGALMQLCFLAELWWAWCFLRTRALLPVAVAHAACALLVEAGLVGGLLRSLEVSGRFFL